MISVTFLFELKKRRNAVFSILNVENHEPRARCVCMCECVRERQTKNEFENVLIKLINTFWCLCCSIS